MANFIDKAVKAYADGVNNALKNVPTTVRMLAKATENKLFNNGKPIVVDNNFLTKDQLEARKTVARNAIKNAQDSKYNYRVNASVKPESTTNSMPITYDSYGALGDGYYYGNMNGNYIDKYNQIKQNPIADARNTDGAAYMYYDPKTNRIYSQDVYNFDITKNNGTDGGLAHKYGEWVTKNNDIGVMYDLGTPQELGVTDTSLLNKMNGDVQGFQRIIKGNNQ